MKAHKVLMIIMLALGVGVLLFGPAINIGRGFGFFLLICPLMMFAMMSGLDHGKNDRK